MPKTVEFINFRPASSAKNETAIVFVHGFTGNVAKTWRRIPEFLQADRRLNEWDLLGVGYQSNRRFDLTGLWSSDARLEEIAIMLHARPELSRYKRLAFIAHSMGDWWYNKLSSRMRICATAHPMLCCLGRQAQD